jgi:hypothetical protein
MVALLSAIHPPSPVFYEHTLCPAPTTVMLIEFIPTACLRIMVQSLAPPPCC